MGKKVLVFIKGVGRIERAPNAVPAGLFCHEQREDAKQERVEAERRVGRGSGLGKMGDNQPNRWKMR